MKTWISDSNRQDRDTLIKFVKRKLAELSDYDVRIYVGTDSQNLHKKPWTGYITAVSFYIGFNEYGEFNGNGVQTIFAPLKIMKERDKFTRLWRESEITLKVVEELRNAGILVHQVDIDYNEDEEHFSSRLLSGGKGLFKGLGYNVAAKPEEQIATRAADHIIHHFNWRNIPLSKI